LQTLSDWALVTHLPLVHPQSPQSSVLLVPPPPQSVNQTSPS